MTATLRRASEAAHRYLVLGAAVDQAAETLTPHFPSRRNRPEIEALVDAVCALAEMHDESHVDCSTCTAARSGARAIHAEAGIEFEARLVE